VFALVGTACRDPGDTQLKRLSTRLDSLATTLATIQKALQPPTSAASDTVLSVKTAGAAGTFGSDTASVVIVEFTDYQCPFCGKHARETLPLIRREYLQTGRVKYVVRDLPLQFHPFARYAAAAARCAGAQGHFGSYHDALFADQAHLSASEFVVLARRNRLDLRRFRECVASPSVAREVDSDAKLGVALGLNGTPAFVIGRIDTLGVVTGKVIRGAYPFVQFQKALDLAMSKPGLSPS
jgi:protein-disulfide isomerase